MKSSIRLLIAGVLLAAFFTPALVQSGSRERNRTIRTTAYTHSESDHIKYGRKTALGTQLKHTTSYTSAAADWSRFPVGTKFKIKGSRTNYIIDDYGSALVGTDTIDIYQPSRSAMNRWGVRHVDIEITEFGDYARSREILSQRTKYRHCRTMLAAIPNTAPDDGKRGWFWNRKPKDNAPAADPAPAPTPAPAATPKVEAPVMLASNDSGNERQFGIRHWFRGRNSDSENSTPATVPAAEPQRREIAPIEATPDVMLASSDNADSPKRTWFWNRKKDATAPASVEPQPVETPVALASNEPTRRSWFGSRDTADTATEVEPARTPVVLASNQTPAPTSAPVSAPRRHAQPAPATPQVAPAPKPEPAPIVIADNTPATAAAMPQIRKVQLTAPSSATLRITNEPVATARRPGSSSSNARPVVAIARPDSSIPHRKRDVRALPAGWKP